MNRAIVICILFFIILLSCNKIIKKEKPIVDDFSVIEKRGKLVALTDYNSTSYFIYRGTPMGFQHDLLEQLAKDLDLELEIKVSNNLADAYSKLEAHECDILAMNLNITNEQKENVAFSYPLGETRQVLVQKKPDDWRRMARYNIEKQLIRNQLGLARKQIHVMQSTAFVSRLENLADEIGDSIFIHKVEYYDTEQLISLVEKGEIDYTVANENMARLHKSYYPDIDVKTPISFQQHYGWGMNPESVELQKVINKWMKKFVKTARYAVIYNRYFINRSASRRAQSDYLSVSGGKISDYDEYIKKYSKLIDWDWRLLASLVYQESRFNPRIKSWAGAYGLMQLMPATAKRFGASKKSSPETNIKAGVKFLKWIDRRFTDSIPDKSERIKFILASYNAGMGHVDDARRLAKANGRNPDLWTDNVDYFILNKSNPEYYDSKLVKYGHLRGVETFNYVKDILERYEKYKKVIQ